MHCRNRYNKIHDVYSCENNVTLGYLKRDLNFTGWVMSDWGATHSTSLMAGLDQEMSGERFMNPTAIKAGLTSGKMTQAAVDEAVFRQLLPMFAIGLFDRPVNNSAQYTNSTTPARNELARDLSANATVMLKNDQGILPLNPASLNSIAVLGWGDGLHVMTHGGGSGAVAPYHQASPYQAIRIKMGLPVDTSRPLRTCNWSTFENGTVYQAKKDLGDARGNGPIDCCQQCRNTDGCDAFQYNGPPVCTTTPQRCPHTPNRTYCVSDPTPEQCDKPPKATCPLCNGTKLPIPRNFHGTCHFMQGRHHPTENAAVISGACSPTPAPPAVDCVQGKCVWFDRGDDTAAAAKLAQAADVAVVFVATTSSEGSDRRSLNLQDNGNALVSAVAAANRRTVVVAATPGALLTPWSNKVQALLVNFMPVGPSTICDSMPAFERTHYLHLLNC